MEPIIEKAYEAPPAVIRWGDANLPAEYWHIAIGRFNARLGPDAMAIAASEHDACKAVRVLLGMSSYADLRNPELILSLDLLIANNQPAANPIFPGSGPMTAAKKAAILGAHTTDYERHIKGLPQPLDE